MIRKLPSGRYRLDSREKDPETGRRRSLGTVSTRTAAERYARVIHTFAREALERRLAFERSRPWQSNAAITKAAIARSGPRPGAMASAPTPARKGARRLAIASAATLTASSSIF